MENYAEEFAKRLRDSLGDTQQADLIKLLAENGFEMTQGRLSHYMQGRNYPDPPVLAELAKALGVSADYLLGLTEQKLPVEDLEEMLATAKGEGKLDKIMCHLPKEQRQQVVTFAQYLLAQSGRSLEVTGSNEAGIDAAMNVLTRKYGADVAEDLIDTLVDNFPDLADLLGTTSPTKRKRVNKS